MAPAVGIDLGTTNSVIAATEAGKPAMIPVSFDVVAGPDGAARFEIGGKRQPGAPRGDDSDVIDAEFTTHE